MINYNEISFNYSIHRNASLTVIDHILNNIKDINAKNILEIGCGTADYLNALNNELKCNSYGFDNSEGMINEGRKKYSGLIFNINDLHNDFEYNDNALEFVYSIDVIHYVKNLEHYYSECNRILNTNGIIVTVTDSEEDLKNRTITKYFPETLEIEKQRYYEIDKIEENMKNSGFKEIKVTHTEKIYEIDDVRYLKFKNKAYSTLRLISEDSFKNGLVKLENDKKNNKCKIKELYTYVWGKK